MKLRLVSLVLLCAATIGALVAAYLCAAEAAKRAFYRTGPHA